MSNLLEQASLVMIPSGYKEDIVYSEIPIDGSGDLQLTRASNGTRVNSSGLVEVVPWNFVEQSESIGTSPWLLNGATLTSGQTDPSGGTTAVKVELASGGNNYVYQGVVLPNPINIVSAYLRADSATTIGFSMGGTTPNTVNLTTTWQLFTFSSADTSGGIIFDNYFGPSPSQQAKTFYIWHPQLNIGSTAKPYFPTTDRLNVPRLTYQNGGGGCPSLLLEKQSTNELSYSEEFDNAAWSVKDNLSVTANATTSPDGTQNADKLVEDSSNSIHRVYRSIDGTSKMFSFFAKPSGRSWVSVLCNNGNTWFDIGNGQLGTVASTSTATIENVGNGWYRCAVYNTHGTFGALIALATGNNGTSYQGDGTSGAFVWGAQLEASSYPTSYIPTTSASATRVADACSKTGISSLIGQTEGTLFADFVWTKVGKTYQSIILGGTSNYNNTVYLLTTESSGAASYQLYIGGATLIANISTTFTNGTRYKIALAYKSGSIAFYVNGVSVGTSAATYGAVSEAISQFRYDWPYSGDEQWCSPVSQTAIFPTRLTNAELASLTTI